jgi:hypothetical protein
MGKKSREKRAKKLERDRKSEELMNEDLVVAGRAFASEVLNVDCDSAELDRPFARFVASKRDAYVRVHAMTATQKRATLAAQWDALVLDWDARSDAEKAAFASTSRVTGITGGPAVPAEQEEVPPDHHDTPAAAAMPSTDDDTHGDESASTTVSASDSTAAVALKLLPFCKSCLATPGQ